LTCASREEYLSNIEGNYYAQGEVSQNGTKNNVVGWVEIPVTNMQRAIKFYETVFGSKLTRRLIGHLDMALFSRIETGSGAAGSLVYDKESRKPSVEGVLIYFTAQSGDLSIELSRIEGAGGRVLVPKNAYIRRHWPHGRFP
jgi:uncharacterized protein